MRSTLASTRARRAARQGFTLLEIVVAVAILAILAGAAVPIAARALTSQARKTTTEELAQLSHASLEYFRDVGKAPTKLAQLEASTAAGWAGPYLPGAMSDPVAGKSGYLSDAWSRAYALTSGATLTITSRAQDGELGTEDDLAIVVDFTPVRREQTLAELAILNQAIRLYNAAHQATDPLPATWKNALAKIVAKGYLPNSTAYRTDAWGDAYEAKPAGSTPLVEIRSTHL